MPLPCSFVWTRQAVSPGSCSCVEYHTRANLTLPLSPNLKHQAGYARPLQPGNCPCLPDTDSLCHLSPGIAVLLGLRLKPMFMPSIATLCTSSCLTRLINSENGTVTTTVSASPSPNLPPTGHIRMTKNSISRLNSSLMGCAGLRTDVRRCSHPTGLFGGVGRRPGSLPLLVLLLFDVLLLVLFLLSWLACTTKAEHRGLCDLMAAAGRKPKHATAGWL